MKEFRRLEKSDLFDIIAVAKASYGSVEYDNFVLEDILSAFDKNQRYKISLYGFFSNGKLVHFAGFGKTVGVGYCYELRLTTTLPEFQGKGYNTRSHENLIAIITSKHRNEPVMVQVATRRPDVYLKVGFKETGHITMYGYSHLIKLYHQRNAPIA